MRLKGAICVPRLLSASTIDSLSPMKVLPGCEPKRKIKKGSIHFRGGRKDKRIDFPLFDESIIFCFKGEGVQSIQHLSADFDAESSDELVTRVIEERSETLERAIGFISKANKNCKRI